MSITLCKANGLQDSMPEIRDIYRSVGLPINDDTMQQIAVPRKQDFGPHYDSWDHVQGKIQNAGTLVRDIQPQGRSTAQHFAFIDWEWYGYNLNPQPQEPLSVLKGLLDDLRDQGLKAGNYGIPFVNNRQDSVTYDRAAFVAQQVRPFSDFLYVDFTPVNAAFYNLSDRLRYIKNARGIPGMFAGWGLPVFVGAQTWTRIGNSRVPLTKDDAITIGHGLRAAHEGGGRAMFWTEEVGKSYEYQIDEVHRVGGWIAEGWHQHDQDIRVSARDMGKVIDAMGVE